MEDFDWVIDEYTRGVSLLLEKYNQSVYATSFEKKFWGDFLGYVAFYKLINPNNIECCNLFQKSLFATTDCPGLSRLLDKKKFGEDCNCEDMDCLLLL